MLNEKGKLLVFLDFLKEELEVSLNPEVKDRSPYFEYGDGEYLVLTEPEAYTRTKESCEEEIIHNGVSYLIFKTN